ncbi:MAG TPA: hypothetical protein VKS78_06865, partial [Roseiarcus sp.]|nr:hypothetical protein [Roseiarcus sp.]
MEAPPKTSAKSTAPAASAESLEPACAGKAVAEAAYAGKAVISVEAATEPAAAKPAKSTMKAAAVKP